MLDFYRPVCLVPNHVRSGRRCTLAPRWHHLRICHRYRPPARPGRQERPARRKALNREHRELILVSRALNLLDAPDPALRKPSRTAARPKRDDPSPALSPERSRPRPVALAAFARPELCPIIRRRRLERSRLSRDPATKTACQFPPARAPEGPYRWEGCLRFRE